MSIFVYKELQEIYLSLPDTVFTSKRNFSQNKRNYNLLTKVFIVIIPETKNNSLKTTVKLV